MNTDSPFTTIGDEPVEARIVAWVLGEASAFEVEELKRLCEERPELMIFKRRMLALHGMLADAEKPDKTWKLPLRKRKVIEDAICEQTPVRLEVAKEKQIRYRARRALLAIAACLVLLVIIGGLAAPMVIKQRKRSGLAEFRSSQRQMELAAMEAADEMKPLRTELPPELIEGTPRPMNVPNLEAPASGPAGSGGWAMGGLAARSSESDKKVAEVESLSLPSAGESHGEMSSLAQRELRPRVMPPPSQPPSRAMASAVPSNDIELGESKGTFGNIQGAPGSVSPPAEPASEMAGSGTGMGFASASPASTDTLDDKSAIAKNDRGVTFDELNSYTGSTSLHDGELRIGGSVGGLASPAPAAQLEPSASDMTYAESKPRAGDGFKGEIHYGKEIVARDKDRQSEAAQLFSLADVESKSVEAGKDNAKKLEYGYTHEYLFKGTALRLGQTGTTALTPQKAAELMEEVSAAQEPYSTFSLNISDASFQVAQAALAKGQRPDPAGIKVEQFYNAVNYGDPAPAAGEPVACTIEQAAHPIIPGRQLVRVALKTAAAGRSAAQPLRLTLLVDQSGSMSRADRRAAMEKALAGLGGLLTAQDKVSVIGFARTSRLLADGVSGGQAAVKLADVANPAASEGGTNLESAIDLAGQLAIRHRTPGAQNRIVLFTDGAANLGDADPLRLAAKVEQLRQKGVAFDIAGIAADDLNDDLLGELARKGNGRYSVVGKGENADFAKQLAGAFRPAAENVKVQVRFNPERVARYKLIGFEKDRLKTEDFRNDKVDAAELAAEEAGVAIYQVEPLPNGRGELGEVSVRFRDTARGEMVERMWTMTHHTALPAIDQATPSMQLATLAMLAGEKLKGGPLASAIDFKQLAPAQAAVKQAYSGDTRVAEMLRMVDALK